MSKTAVIFKHTHNQGSCLFGKVLKAQGWEIKSLGVPVMDFDDFDPLEPDLLLIMGAPIGVYQADAYPFIDKELDVIKKRLEAGRAILGICFGSQLIAKALGADVYPGPNGKEIGWYRLSITDAGKEHSVRYLGGENTNMLHWHGDTFDLPEGATLLASSERYKQAFSYGDNVLGLQCHPEVTDNHLKERYVVFANEVTGPDAVVDIKDLRVQGDKYVGVLNQQVEKFLIEWIDQAGL